MTNIRTAVMTTYNYWSDYADPLGIDPGLAEEDKKNRMPSLRVFSIVILDHG